MTERWPAVAIERLIGATDDGPLGLYPAQSFRLTEGNCDDSETIRAALWYFRNETIAVPKRGARIAGFERGIGTFVELRSWYASRDAAAPIDYPPLVWIGAPHRVRNARLSETGDALFVDGAVLPLERVGKIPLNRSYYNESSTRFFARHSVSARGTFRDGRFVVRMLWPEEFRLRDAPSLREIDRDVSTARFLRRLMREEPHGGARSPYAAFTLWRRDGTPIDWRDRAVLAFIVNGAQGDDDEAHAGHFAIVTGRIAEDGSIADWLVNNFYTLDAESEKGIIAAPVPLDNYLADLNSGQAYYRPSYLLVCVLSRDRAAAFVQSALGRIYNQFYRHQLVYYHPSTNCTSISIDTLRALDLAVPARGPTSRLLAWTGFPIVAAKGRSLRKAKLAFDYMTVDQTRLFPATAIEETFAAIVRLCQGVAHSSRKGSLARMMSEDVDAIAFLRIPQFPSSRAWGDAPAVSAREYRARLPRDRSKMQIVPVPVRQFPDDLRDPDLLPPQRHPSDIATVVWGALLLFGVPALVVKIWRRFARRG